MELSTLLERLPDFTTDAILVVTGDGFEVEDLRILYANRAFCELSGYTAEEAVGKNICAFDVDGNCRKTQDKLKNAIIAKRAVIVELQNRAKSGREYWIEMGLTPIMRDDDTCAFFVIVERDITDRKEKEFSLVRAKEGAEAANQAQSDFLATMSHELRTPMNGILGLTEILQGMEIAPDVRECVTAIKNSGAALLNILNDILDLSKIEAGEISLENRPFDLRDVLHSVRDLTAPASAQKGLEYDIRLGLDVGSWFMGDGNRIKQILFNLLSNAIKFTDKGGVTLKIDQTPAKDGCRLKITVADTGIGISDAFKDKLFHKFTQADSSISRRFGGTGLGLTITRNLIEMMDGTISFVSQEGAGTTFFVDIALIPTIDPAIAHVDEVKRRVDKGTKTFAELINIPISDLRVLVVEDHPVNQMLAEKWLHKMGIEQVDCVANGFESLSHLRNNRYNVILMDCQMPELDGYETTSLIRDMEKNLSTRTPIIAMTANAMMGEREKCIASGMDDYVAKPIQWDALQDSLVFWINAGNDQDGRKERVHMETAETKAAAQFEDPVDLTRFREFTDGDQEVERELLKVFTTNTELLLMEMAGACEDGPSEEWRRASHTMKGAAGNLGAARLHQLCLKAERLFDKNKTVKEHVLDLIRMEYKNVLKFLSALPGADIVDPDTLAAA